MANGNGFFCRERGNAKTGLGLHEVQDFDLCMCKTCRGCSWLFFASSNPRMAKADPDLDPVSAGQQFTVWGWLTSQHFDRLNPQELA